MWVQSLAAAGVLPFLGLTLAAFSNVIWAVHAFAVYSVAITAFLAGSWWGIHLTKTPPHRTPWRGLIASNLLVLLSVAGLLSGSAAAALVTQTAILTLLLVGERILQPLSRAPAYYQRMRLWVSAAVIGLHIAQLSFILSSS